MRYTLTTLLEMPLIEVIYIYVYSLFSEQYSDLVNTLLHEMIHAYFFVAEREHCRTDHGVDFQHKMQLINAAEKSSITVYHSFKDEVDHHRQHWWQCRV